MFMKELSTKYRDMSYALKHFLAEMHVLFRGKNGIAHQLQNLF